MGHSECQRAEVARRPDMPITPYLLFEGRCEEALAFYQRAIGAKVEMLMRNDETPEPPPPGVLPPGSEKKICHAQLVVGDATVMASDGHCSGSPTFQGFRLSLALPDAASAKRAWDALLEGGEVQMPLGQTFWSPCFGMLTDRFGLGWMVTVVG